MKIQILGTGCPKCRTLYENACQAVQELNIEADVIKVEDITESDKLVKLMVDFGDHKRNIVVGMKKERENPQEIEGKQALFVVNLESRKMMGHESQGMLYDIGK